MRQLIFAALLIGLLVAGGFAAELPATDIHAKHNPEKHPGHIGHSAMDLSEGLKRLLSFMAKAFAFGR